MNQKLIINVPLFSLAISFWMFTNRQMYGLSEEILTKQGVVMSNHTIL